MLNSSTANSPKRTRNFRQFKDNLFPNPEDFNDFVVHTYARPRGLNAVYGSSKKDLSTSSLRYVAVPLQRTGISGWKLSRAKTANPRRKRRGEIKERSGSKESLLVDCKHIDIKNLTVTKNKSLQNTRRMKSREI